MLTYDCAVRVDTIRSVDEDIVGCLVAQSIVCFGLGVCCWLVCLQE